MNNPIISGLSRLKKLGNGQSSDSSAQNHTIQRPSWRQLAEEQAVLPDFVQASPVAMRYLKLLAPLAWEQFPERDLETDWLRPAVPYAPFAAACLVKLDQGIVYMPHLHQYLREHPALIWVLGFPLVASVTSSWGFDVEASLPSARHFTRMLRKMPNACLQFLLDETVRLLRDELSTQTNDFGQCISLDTKHIVAWVRENNPKAYFKGQRRYDKENQPADPDCRVGVKRRRNQRASSEAPPPTPLDNPVPAKTIAVAEYYWGYASGVVATKVPDWGEFVIAELTLPFDRPDVAYFHPLMALTEQRLGFRPKFGTLDAAYDAFYVYEYFHREGKGVEVGFAAVPFANRGARRTFDAEGLPLCEAGLSMPVKYTFINRTSFVEHERGHHVCPLLHPEASADACPVGHKKWGKGGCTTRLPTSIGARIRHQLDRESSLYKEVYKQRTATERINAQATALGIERPRLRNGQAITNLNTLIYVLINLRALHRVRQKKATSLEVSPLAG